MSLRHFLSTRACAAALLFLLLPCVLPAQTRTDLRLTMSDGAALETFSMRPAGTPPSGGWPGIVFVHGFNGSMEDNAAQARAYAQLGYMGLSYSVRGQGGSEGVFDFFTSERVLADLRAMIDWLKAQPDVRADRIAVVGGSQGGIHAWAAAAHQLGARCVVSIIANGRFDENWVENDALNWTFARAIGFATARLSPELKAVVDNAVSTGEYEAVKQFLADHSTEPFEAAAQAPTAIFVSMYDGFFNQNAALRQFARIGAPKRFMLYPAGHTVPPAGTMRNDMTRQLDAWLAYWLKDDAQQAAIAAPDSAVVLIDGATQQRRTFAVKDSAFWLSAPAVPPRGLERRVWHFAPEGLREQVPVAAQRSISYVNLVGSTPVTFRTPPFAQPVTIAASEGRAVVRSDGTGSQYQMSLSLFDVDPAGGVTRPISRGHAQVRVNAAGEEVLTFALTQGMHTIEAGRVIEARVHGGVALIPNTANDFGNFVLGPVQNSTNTLFMGGAEPSRIELVMYDASALVSAHELPRPLSLVLEQNAPNPFNPSTVIGYALPSRGHIRLTVHDARGAQVAVLVDDERAAGRHSAVWHAGSLPSGVYYARITSASGAAQRGMVLMK